MLKGTTSSEYGIIKNILKAFPHKFYAYGARVRGDFTPLSDLDLGVKGKISPDELTTLKEEFDRSTLPYIVNITMLDNIDENFYNLIKKDLVEL